MISLLTRKYYFAMLSAHNRRLSDVLVGGVDDGSDRALLPEVIPEAPRRWISRDAFANCHGELRPLTAAAGDHNPFLWARRVHFGP